MRGINDQFDVTLEDTVLLSEVELTANLIVAAGQSEGHLSVDEIDRILGIDPTEFASRQGDADVAAEPDPAGDAAPDGDTGD